TDPSGCTVSISGWLGIVAPPGLCTGIRPADVRHRRWPEPREQHVEREHFCRPSTLSLCKAYPGQCPRASTLKVCPPTKGMRTRIDEEAVMSETPAAPDPDEARVVPGWSGRLFEDFTAGDVYYHPFGKTVTEADNQWFTL